MDEIVFLREQLRRSLLDQIALIEKAAEAYDPEKDLPVDDIIVVASDMGTHAIVRKYAEAIRERMQTRRGGADR